MRVDGEGAGGGGGGGEGILGAPPGAAQVLEKAESNRLDKLAVAPFVKALMARHRRTKGGNERRKKKRRRPARRRRHHLKL